MSANKPKSSSLLPHSSASARRRPPDNIDSSRYVSGAVSKRLADYTDSESGSQSDEHPVRAMHDERGRKFHSSLPRQSDSANGTHIPNRATPHQRPKAMAKAIEHDHNDGVELDTNTRNFGADFSYLLSSKFVNPKDSTVASGPKASPKRGKPIVNATRDISSIETARLGPNTSVPKPKAKPKKKAQSELLSALFHEETAPSSPAHNTSTKRFPAKNTATRKAAAKKPQLTSSSKAALLAMNQEDEDSDNVPEFVTRTRRVTKNPTGFKAKPGTPPALELPPGMSIITWSNWAINNATGVLSAAGESVLAEHDTSVEAEREREEEEARARASGKRVVGGEKTDEAGGAVARKNTVDKQLQMLLGAPAAVESEEVDAVEMDLREASGESEPEVKERSPQMTPVGARDRQLASFLSNASPVGRPKIDDDSMVVFKRRGTYNQRKGKKPKFI